MSSIKRVQILYPTKKEIASEWFNRRLTPEAFYHLTYYQCQICIFNVRNRYSVRTMNYIPTFIVTPSYDSIHAEWLDVYNTKDFDSAVYFFQKSVKDCIAQQNKLYLSKVFNRNQLYKEDLPQPVIDVLEVFNP